MHENDSSNECECAALGAARTFDSDEAWGCARTKYRDGTGNGIPIDDDALGDGVGLLDCEADGRWQRGRQLLECRALRAQRRMRQLFLRGVAPIQMRQRMRAT